MLRESPAVVNVVHLPGASLKPRGDVVLCDVAREDASVVIEDLRSLGLGLAEQGSIAIDEIDTSISDVARQAERAAAGSPADAVVWEEVESRTSESAELSFSFVAFMVLATLIAAAGIMTDSQILIIGAMVVGPEFGPLAGFSVAVVQRRLDLARRSLAALAVGFPVAIAASCVLTLVLRALGPAPDMLTAVGHPATLFIAAGIVVTEMRTPISAPDFAVVRERTPVIPASRATRTEKVFGFECLTASGIATLGLQRVLYRRRRRRHRREPAGSGPSSSSA